MYTFKNLLAVTNRKLCDGDFLEQLRWLAGEHPVGIILREKDLEEAEYEKLTIQVMSICEEYNTPCILHTFTDCARRLGCARIHLPLWKLRQEQESLEEFWQIGVSVHSLEEAREAQSLGATYLTAGHIFATDCKKGLPGRGLPFLREICQEVQIPVYGIGGITEENAGQVLAQGAEGYCVMSGIMKKRG